jgi:hypothetical protein
VRAEDSPNVRLALLQQSKGLQPTGEVLVPGVLTWEEYQKRRATWDQVRQTIGLDAEFYQGAEVLLFPADWLDRAHSLADALRGRPRVARTIGCDPAEGGDRSVWAVVDDLGLIFLLSLKTPDTTVVPARTLALMRDYDVPAERVYMDRGGGGKEHADRLRAMGHKVNTVAFGESPQLELRRMQHPLGARREMQEEKYAYVNRRAEMYGTLRRLLDPSHPTGFALPREYAELRRQLAPIPLTYDPEGRLMLLPKDKRDKDGKKPTLRELLGCSPDEADALVLAVYGLTAKPKSVAGAIVTGEDFR